MDIHPLPEETGAAKGDAKVARRRSKSGHAIRVDDRYGKVRDRHGMTGTPEHQSWLSMIQRCYDPKCKAYPRYGGRGIIVCERWKASFRNFYEDMGSCNGLTLERKDGNGIYEKDNCIWATHKQQNRNKSDNRYITHDGRTMLLQTTIGTGATLKIFSGAEPANCAAANRLGQ
jgi:hypothetical protein